MYAIDSVAQTKEVAPQKRITKDKKNCLVATDSTSNLDEVRHSNYEVISMTLHPIIRCKFRISH